MIYVDRVIKKAKDSTDGMTSLARMVSETRGGKEKLRLQEEKERRRIFREREKERDKEKGEKEKGTEKEKKREDRLERKVEKNKEHLSEEVDEQQLPRIPCLQF